MKVISENQIAEYLSLIQNKGLLDQDDSSLIVFDLGVMRDRVSRIESSFGENAFHAIAVKSNPLRFALKELAGLGVGLEAASIGEVLMASQAGLPPERIVFDSPAKTRQELQYLQDSFPGIRVNCDSLAELNRIPKGTTSLAIGLRVNPIVSGKTHESMNVGSARSKFGESISNRSGIIDHCCQWDALDCLHFHIGSQHQDFSPVVEACNKILDLADEINAKVKGKIERIDIGGGFPVNYDGVPFLIEDYAERLKRECPRLFSGQYQIITEFGRYVHANAAFVASRIEYVKQNPIGKTVVIHVGADMFLRECYNPGSWFHKISTLNSDFVIKEGATTKTDIAGPLCFGGDFIQRGAELPNVSSDDWVVIQDVGANSFSLWSRHCSRPFPKVVSIDSGTAIVEKSRESLESVVSFWN